MFGKNSIVNYDKIYSFKNFRIEKNTNLLRIQSPYQNLTKKL